jgi:hypothetical protein
MTVALLAACDHTTPTPPTPVVVNPASVTTPFSDYTSHRR